MKVLVEIPIPVYKAYKRVPEENTTAEMRAIRDGIPIFSMGKWQLCVPSGEYECGNCGFRMPTYEKDGSLKDYDFCPRCGAKMGEQ